MTADYLTRLTGELWASPRSIGCMQCACSVWAWATHACDMVKMSTSEFAVEAAYGMAETELQHCSFGFSGQ